MTSATRVQPLSLFILPVPSLVVRVRIRVWVRLRVRAEGSARLRAYYSRDRVKARGLEC